MELEPYLFFDGRCEEALQFYARVFAGEVVSLNRFEGSPLMGDLPPDYGQKIMHASFRAGDVRFMASDGPRESGGAGRVSLSLSTTDAARGERVFAALAEGGNVRMPLQDTFWGSRFGMLTDRYGIDWMVNCELARGGS